MDTPRLLQLGSLSIEVKTLLLLVFLAIAAKLDITSRRIPNQLVLAGLAASFILQINFNGFEGFKAWGAGLLVGFGLLLPLYLLHVMGAGDVKLMAMVGSYIGPFFVLGATLATLLVGGILAIFMAIYSGTLMQTLKKICTMLTLFIHKTLAGGDVQLDAPVFSADSLPYAVAIALGTLIQLILTGKFGA
jgi:prepilin peptidase CpaA